MTALTKLAILDDYQGVALSMGPWDRLPKSLDITVFRDTLKDEDALAARLAPFDAILAMRERTRFPASLLKRLPNLAKIDNDMVSPGERDAAKAL